MKTILISLIAAFSVSAFAKIENKSVYTSVDPQDCITIESSEFQTDPEIDYYTAECAGFGGYKAIVSGGDIRYNLSLNFEGQDITLARPPSFHDLGSKMIEWRYEQDPNKSVKLTSLIYRLTVTDGADGTNSDVLYVVRLNGAKSCLIGAVSSGDLNERAREIADDASAQCL